MRKIVLMLPIFLMAAGCAGKKGLINVTPSLLTAQEDVVGLKSEVSGKMGVIEGEVAAVKGDVSAIKGDMSIVKGNLEKLMIAPQGAANIGAGNTSTQQTAGGDIVTETTNDTELMKFIIDKWWMVFLAIIGLMKWYSMRDDRKHAAELKRLEAEKKFYKDNLLARAVKDENDLAELRKKHDESVGKEA